MRTILLAVLVVGTGLTGRALTGQKAHDSPPTEMRPEPPAHQEMRTLDDRSRFDMILYQGRFGQGDMATGRKSLESIALALTPSPSRE